MSNRLNIAYVGGPGTGKSSSIVKQISEIINNENDCDIIIISKTNSAMQVLKEKLWDILTRYGKPETEIGYFLKNVRTIDSFSLDFFEEFSGESREKIKNKIWEIVVENHLRYNKRSELVECIRKVFKLDKINPDNLSSKSYYGSHFYEGDEIYIISAINFIEHILYKNGGLKYDIKDIEEFEERNINFFRAYRLIKSRETLELGKLRNVIDRFIYLIESGRLYTFSYIVFSAIKEAKDKIKYVFVDEANELSPLYANFVLNVGKNIVWGLDPMQTIYNFSGFSDLTYNLILESKPKIIALATQYRIPDEIYKNIIRFIKSEINIVGEGYLKRFFGDMYNIVLDYLHKTRSVVSNGEMYIYNGYTIDGIINFLKTFRYSAIVLTRRISFKNILKRRLNISELYYRDSYFDKLLNILYFLFIKDGYRYNIHTLKDYIKKNVFDELLSKGVLYIDGNYAKSFGLYKFIDYHFNITEKMKNKIIEEFNNLKEEKNTKLYISTIHNTKGKEFDNVIVINDFSVRTMEIFKKNYPDVYLYEVSVEYVGMTRCKRNLFVIHLI